MAIRRINRTGDAKRRQSHAGKLAVFFIFQFIFAAVIMPLLIFYGPFENVKKKLVGTSWATLNHRWIAQMFLSDEQIEKLVGEDYAVVPIEDGEMVVREVSFTNAHSRKIEQYNVSGNGYSGKMLVIHDPTRVTVGISSKIPQAGETTSQIAKNMGAVAAINAGGFSDEGYTGIGGLPDGYIISGGKVKFNSYNDNNAKTYAVGLNAKGMLVMGFHSANELLSFGVKEAVSFGPALVVNGQRTINQGDGGWGIAPRSAIGQTEDGAILLLVIDGRSIWSLGATLRDMQEIMLEYGALNACNLDGGSSTTLVSGGKVINRPSDGLGERAVPSAFVVMP